MTPLRLYTLPASHPCATVEAALQLKGIPYRRTDFLPLAQLVAGPIIYGGFTVPGARVDGERMHGSRAILRKLDQLEPEPPLLPEDEGERARVLDAERWGDEVFQDVPRRLLDAAFLRDPQAMGGYAEGAKLPLSVERMRPLMGLTARGMAWRNHATDERAREDVRGLPAQLDRIDGWIGEGLLGGERPNAADLQIGSSIRLLTTLGDVRALIEGRPAAALSRYFPPQPGEVGAGTLPAEWLAR